MPDSPILIDLPALLEGPRVIVRPYGPDDAQQVWEAVEESREHLAPWMPWVHFYKSIDDAREFAVRAQARWMLREDLVVGIFDKATGAMLGGSGLHRIDWQVRKFEIGYWLRQSAEGKGYMKETVRLLTRLAFEDLKANRVEIRMDTRNERSRNVAERLGFVLEGTTRNDILAPGGALAGHHVYSLIPDEYRRLEWTT